MSSVTRKPQAHRHRRPWHMVWQDEIFKRWWRKHAGKPAIAQLVEHLTVELCSDQMVPGSIPDGRIFSCVDLIQLLRTTHDRSTMPDTQTTGFFFRNYSKRCHRKSNRTKILPQDIRVILPLGIFKASLMFGICQALSLRVASAIFHTEQKLV